MKLLIYGTGSFAELAHYYFENESQYSVVAFVETEKPDIDELNGLPVLTESEVLREYSTDTYSVFVAIGYREMNLHRMKVCTRLIELGYNLASFVSPDATTHDNVIIGANVFVFEKNNIQPFCTIEDGVVLWSGNHIGHHSVVHQYSFVSSHVVVSGHCSVGERSFLGVNSTMIDGVKLGARNLLGAGATVVKNTEDGDVWVAKHTVKASGDSLKYM